MHDCLNDQPARTVCKVAQFEIYACLAAARARAARLIQPEPFDYIPTLSDP